MNIKKFRKIWDEWFEYDRVAERKVIKSVELWNSNNIMKQIRAMMMYNQIRKKYNCHINPRIILGHNFYIAHASGIVIGQTSEIGDDCRIYPGAKLIAKIEGDKDLVEDGLRRHPKIGNRCLIGADCLIIGRVTIGDDVTIGAGAIVTKDVPNNCLVIGTNIIKEKEV